MRISGSPALICYSLFNYSLFSGPSLIIYIHSSRLYTILYLHKLIGNSQLSVGDGTVIGAINQINSNLGELNTGLIHQKVYLGINPNTGSVITVNCQSKINGVIYIDALIQTTSAATDQGDLLTISKDIYGNLINVPKRIDAVLMGSDQNYFVVCKKDTGVFKVNGATIPAGTYKLILIIDS